MDRPNKDNRFTMIRIVKIAMMFSVGCWGLTGFMSNMLDFAYGQGQVKYVISMEGAKDAPGVEWRRITSPIIVPFIATIGFAFIWVSKFLTGVLCLYGSARMFISRKADTATFAAAKEWGLLGCGISVVMLFLGFIVITGQYFAYWRVPVLGMITHDYAFFYLLSLMGFLLFLQSPEGEPK